MLKVPGYNEEREEPVVVSEDARKLYEEGQLFMRELLRIGREGRSGRNPRMEASKIRSGECPFHGSGFDMAGIRRAVREAVREKPSLAGARRQVWAATKGVLSRFVPDRLAYLVLRHKFMEKFEKKKGLGNETPLKFQSNVLFRILIAELWEGMDIDVEKMVADVCERVDVYKKDYCEQEGVEMGSLSFDQVELMCKFAIQIEFQSLFPKNSRDVSELMRKATNSVGELMMLGQFDAPLEESESMPTAAGQISAGLASGMNMAFAYWNSFPGAFSSQFKKVIRRNEFDELIENSLRRLERRSSLHMDMFASRNAEEVLDVGRTSVIDPRAIIITRGERGLEAGLRSDEEFLKYKDRVKSEAFGCPAKPFIEDFLRICAGVYKREIVGLFERRDVTVKYNEDVVCARSMGDAEEGR